MDTHKIADEAFGMAAFMLTAATLSRAIARGDMEKREVSAIVGTAREFSKVKGFPGEPAVIAYAERLLTVVEQIVGTGSQHSQSRSEPH